MPSAVNYVEKQVAKLTIKTLLDQGYSISVNDGEETTLKRSRNEDEILKAMMTSGEDYLYVYRDDVQIMHNGECGWVYFVYGNDGYDVISDYSTNLQDDLFPVFAWIKREFDF